ncbi:MAG: hypothetical protein AAGC96_15640 [Pseudomonadota bacterium]
MLSRLRKNTRKVLHAVAWITAVASLSTGSMVASSLTVSAATGADQSEQGCIGSAGYTWSQLRQECVRLFEVGVPLYNAQDPDATTVAYMVSGGSAQPLELFLPDQAEGILMFFQDGAWHDDDHRYTLTNSDDDVLDVRDAAGKLLFSSRKPG